MIITGKIKLLAAAGVVILALITALGWVWSSRDRLQQAVGGLEQSIDQLKQSATDREAENAELRAELDRRDALVAQAVRDRQRANDDARAAQSRLKEALATDECAHTDHPGAVADSLRRHRPGDSDQNRVPNPAHRTDGADPDA